MFAYETLIFQDVFIMDCEIFSFVLIACKILTNLMIQKFDFHRFQLVLFRQFSAGKIVKFPHCDQLATLQHLLDKDARSTISSSSS